ncbi:MAG: hydantoinase B/oxoprolinase family protein [Chloroflexota bacterium]|nr:hydantoinase B/oxoprolinase family protein [Chloroflexota bacterium]
MSFSIELELLKNAAESVADQMALTIVRTARSSVAKDSMDFSTSLVNVKGDVVAQGLCQPRHMCAIPSAAGAVIERYKGQYQEGDIYILNDPYEGGTHLPDIYLFKPVFLERKLIGFSCAIVHHTDVGGRVAGGNASNSTEIYQEGLRIPPLKLYDAGEPNETLFRIIDKNVRVPDKVAGDFRAQISACELGERGFQDLGRQYGLDRLETLFDHLLDYTEELTRQAISRLQDGQWEFADHIDNDGFTNDPVPIRVRIKKAGDTITADYTGTSPQVKGAINSTLSYTSSITYACVKSVLGVDIPNNAGFFRPINIVAPEGSFVNPQLPAPVAARGLAAMRITETLFGAFAKMLPDKIFACGVGLDTGVTIAGYFADRRPFLFLEFMYVSWGGGPDRDGIDGASLPHSNYSNTPIEVIEAEQPVMIDCYGFVPDRCGAGKFRGGLAFQRHYRLLADEADLQLRSDRQKYLPYGLHGGQSGKPSISQMNRNDGDLETLPSKGLFQMQRGNVFHHITAGAAGWGDPLDRDVNNILEDVVNEKLSPEYVRREYSVVVERNSDGITWEINFEATEQLRQR